MSKINSNELKHHGVKGQKWGIRLYQNRDGSLTALGRRRVNKMKDEYTKLTGKQLRRKPTSKKSATDEDQNKKTVSKKRLRDMTDDELKNRIARLRSEKEAAQLEADTATKGQKIIRSIGKDVIAPAAISAGKQLLTDKLLQIGKDKFGLNPKEAQDAYKELRKEVDGLELEARKAVAKEKIARSANSKAQQEAQRVKTENNTSKKKKEKREAEPVEAEFVGNIYDYRKQKWNTNKLRVR